ncbi:MAG: hypothetical protein GY906_16570, partial [bacterium]|nr:hypothetical protein [bacterium]
DAAGRMSEILRDAANRAPSMTQLRYDGRSYLSRSTLKSFLGMGVRDWVTRATYSSEGVLHHRAIERHPTPASPRGEGSVEGDDYVFYFAGRPVGQVNKRSTTPGSGDKLILDIVYVTADLIGTPALLTNYDREVLLNVELEPFGVAAEAKQFHEFFVRFPGQWEDSTWPSLTTHSPLYYNVYRWYQPGAGRYARPDPLGVRVTQHLYLYTVARPTVFIDSFGLFRSGGDLPPCLVEYLENRMPDVRFHRQILSGIGAATGTGLEGVRMAQEAVQWGKGPIVVLNAPRAMPDGRIPFGKHMAFNSDIILLHPKDVEELCRCGPGPNGTRLLEIGKTLLHELAHWIEGRTSGARLDYEVGDAFEIITYGEPPGGSLGFPSWRNNQCCEKP